MALKMEMSIDQSSFIKNHNSFMVNKKPIIINRKYLNKATMSLRMITNNMMMKRIEHHRLVLTLRDSMESQSKISSMKVEMIIVKIKVPKKVMNIIQKQRKRRSSIRSSRNVAGKERFLLFIEKCWTEIIKMGQVKNIAMIKKAIKVQEREM